MASDQLVLDMRGIAKQYGAVQALKGVDFTLRPGEVMALLGENGAGKSTLVKILAGLERPDAGTVAISGRTVRIRSPQHSLQSGIAYVTQELSIVPVLSVAENICLGADRLSPFWTAGRLAERVAPYLRAVGLDDIDPATPAGQLSVAQQQLIEIARLLSRSARVLILDEPTAALSDVEIAKVMTVVRSLADQGRSIIYVTHRLGEVFEIADRVTIFRNGNSFDPVEVKTLAVDQLIEHLLGRRLDQMFPPRGAGGGEPVLELTDVIAPGLAQPLSLQLRAGEIVGLAGQIGSGANAIVRAIAGIQPRLQGQILLKGELLDPRDMRAAMARGVAYCSDDRKRDGIFGVRRVIENFSAPAMGRITTGGLLSRRREEEMAGRLARLFDFNVARLGSQAGKLSGGNQQKVALGKWLGIDPVVLLVEEPTRGVDVGARAEIYRHLRTLADKGLAIIFVSSDNQEVLGLADTIATFFRGRLVRVAAAKQLTPEALLRDVTHPETAGVGA